MSTPISREALDELKALQISFLRARLVSPRAEAEWRANLEAVYAILLERPLSDLMPRPALIELLDKAVAAPSPSGLVLPLAQALHSHVISVLGRDPYKVGAYVPPSARAKVDELLQRPDLLPEKLIRSLAEEEALQGVMRDVLYDALKQFNDGVNPFFAEWGLPALLKRFVPIGAGAILKSLDTVRTEFDKRLEPEIRKFLQGFSRKALKRFADIAVASREEPNAIAVRRAVAAWVYEQDVRALVETATPDATARVDAIGHEIAAHAVTDPELRTHLLALRNEQIDKFYEAFGAIPLRDSLAKLGMHASPDFDALAKATFPLLRVILESAPIGEWIESLVAEFFDGQAVP